MLTARKSVLSIAHLGTASVAAMAACTVCCVAPVLAAAGVGSGTVATLFRSGSELWVGGAAFAVTLGATALHKALRPARKRCGEACRHPGSVGTARSSTPGLP